MFSNDIVEDEIRKTQREVGPLVQSRMKEFEEKWGDENRMFEELCFCILTANYTAKGGLAIQEEVGEGFLKLDEARLVASLTKLGHRYPKARSKYIVEARRLHGRLSETVEHFEDAREAREWLVRNVKGFGYKEASHFLRNVGFRDVAILDRHILRYLKERGLIEEVPKTLGQRSYLKLEILLSAIARKLKLSLGELDLYLWYIMTGEVLK